MPLWGFAVVEKSTVNDVEEGTRLYGYLPTSSHLIVEPAKVDEKGFRDASPHRQHLPSPYNGLTTTTADPAYDADQEDLQVLYRPLFMTSFMLADFLQDNGCFGAETAVISSASSKTSYGTAFLLDDIHRVGLTSDGNRAFTESLGCYDEVLTYDEVADHAGQQSDLRRRRGRRQPPPPRARAPRACALSGRRRVPPRRRAGPRRRAITFLAAARRSSSRPTRCASAMQTGAPTVSRRGTPRRGRGSRLWWPNWVDVVVGTGPEALQADWLETLAGATPPRIGHVVQL